MMERRRIPAPAAVVVVAVAAGGCGVARDDGTELVAFGGSCSWRRTGSNLCLVAVGHFYY